MPVEVQTAGGSISQLVQNYPDLYIESVDGCDVEASYQAMSRAVEWCRARKGPALIHASVVRPYSHSMSDDEKAYKTEQQRDDEKGNDPLDIMVSLLVKRKIATKAQIQDIQASVDAEIALATESALVAETPTADEVFDHIYSEDVTRPLVTLTRRQGIGW